MSDIYQRALFPFTHPTVGDTNGNTRDDRAFPLPRDIGAARACARHATSAVRTAPGWLICFVRLTCWRLCCFPWGGGGKIPLIVPVYNKCAFFRSLDESSWLPYGGATTGSSWEGGRGGSDVHVWLAKVLCSDRAMSVCSEYLCRCVYHGPSRKNNTPHIVARSRGRVFRNLR